MSKIYITVALRRLVMTRARRLCEYCLIHEDDTYWGCQVDHIISEKHGGATEADNLAYACSFGNRNKGSDIGSIVWRTGQFCRFLILALTVGLIILPCAELDLRGVRIEALKDIGEATARILDFNNIDGLIERQELQTLGRYPAPDALALISNNH